MMTKKIEDVERIHHCVFQVMERIQFNSIQFNSTNEWMNKKQKEMTKSPRFSTDENLPVWSTRHESNTPKQLCQSNLFWTFQEKESKQTSYRFYYFWF